jgi:hypothetical protein
MIDPAGFPRLLPVLCMISVIVLMRFVTAWQAARRQRAELVRLRRGMCIELAGIRAALDENLRQVAAQSTHVVGTRHLFVLLRGQAGQLSRLSEPELAALLAAHAANERLEALLAVRGKPGSSTAYRLPAEQEALAEIGRTTLGVMAALDTALALLNAPSGSALPPAPGEATDPELDLALTPVPAVID